MRSFLLPRASSPLCLQKSKSETVQICFSERNRENNQVPSHYKNRQTSPYPVVVLRSLLPFTMNVASPLQAAEPISPKKWPKISVPHTPDANMRKTASFSNLNRVQPMHITPASRTPCFLKKKDSYLVPSHDVYKPTYLGKRLRNAVEYSSFDFIEPASPTVPSMRPSARPR